MSTIEFNQTLLPGNYPIPTEHPEYHSRGGRKTRSKGRLWSMVDSLFVALALGMTFWFAGLLLLSGLELHWQSIVLLILFWAVLAYLALPRMHQLFTTLYVPDYFMARTKTGDGLLGDPVNLALLGSEADIHAAMKKAGWVKADEITLRSSWGIVKSSVTGKSYPEAPVSSLFLFGRRHAFAYQQEVDGSAAQRHHVRFWPTPEDWDLPGGQKVDWLAAGTYDKAVGLSTLTFQVTHKIDDDIDAERDYIINTVRFADPECQVAVLDSFSTPFHDRNGGGDAVWTDGNMPVLDVQGAAQRNPATSSQDEAQQAAGATSENNQNLGIDLDKPLPPASLSLVGFFTILQVVLVGLIGFGVWLTNADMSVTERHETNIGIIIAGAAVLVELVLYLLTVRRHQWARLILLALAALSALNDLLALATYDARDFGHFLTAALSLLIVLALTAPEVRAWVNPTKRARSGDLQSLINS
ncbi:hypothetical protein BSR29_01160 [Boudabousia liubingyangii]|uniref:LssY-like C-terminal domain-containing protein n=1 Tax=Boudabousia liubingyangii TaxID=1921764 RepID=A0A1Q5PQ05_9ACTO|nr:LssY C-terminal domain-containing protein [Boudabousia liubingyangii]OKL49596.1 hypothetical protein BSR29_01160 [Boudabousia liubingyangii]